MDAGFEKNNTIYVRTFSGFSARYNGEEIARGSAGESQIGMLLLLLFHFGEAGVERNLVRQTLFEDRDIEDVSHAIRNVIYNMRKRLRELGLPDANYVRQSKGVYYWTGEVGVWEDAHEFEKAYNEALQEQDQGRQAELLIDNCYRYAGRFFQGLESVGWIFREAERYSDIFSDSVERAAYYLRSRNMYKDLYDLGSYAMKADPFKEWEVLVMEALTGLGRYQEAEEFFDSTVETYITEYGNRSNEYVRDLIKKLGEYFFHRHETIDQIQDKLTSSEDLQGKGYYCSLPVFQELYRTVERTMQRSGEKIFLMLCTIVDSKGNPMREGPRLDELSERLKTTIIESVRHTDTVTRYGQGQFLVLLINTTKENCAVVEKRIRSRFLIKRQRTGVEFDVNGLIIQNREIQPEK